MIRGAIIFCLLAAGASTFADFRSLSDSDVNELVQLNYKALKDCIKARSVKSIAPIDMANRTDEHVDKDGVIQELQRVLSNAGVVTESDSKFKINAVLTSTTESGKKRYQKTYQLKATLNQGGQMICESEASVIKSSEMK